jgi:hypothetical protein
VLPNINKDADEAILSMNVFGMIYQKFNAFVKQIEKKE